MSSIELWGGVECTVNRVRDRFFDQLHRSGHAARADDLERFAAIGITTLRCPVLWERLAPHSPDEIDWRWADAYLARMRELRLRPIAARPAISRPTRPVRGCGCGTIPVGGCVDTRERAVDHGQVQRAVRPLVPAPT